MIFGVILCAICVISVQTEAGVIKPPRVIGQDAEMKRFREENDAYGAETVQLNGRTPRAPSWPEANSIKKKMFLLPSILNEGDQINITGVILNDPQWVSFSLITERNGANGTEPDHNNVAAQLELHFPSNSSSEGKIILKTKLNGLPKEINPSLEITDLIPDSTSGKSFPLTVTVTMVVTSSGNEIEFKIEESYVDKITLEHHFNDIRYIALDGDVDKVKRLDFIYA